jgi:hypothetical protein
MEFFFASQGYLSFPFFSNDFYFDANKEDLLDVAPFIISYAETHLYQNYFNMSFY